MTPQEQLARDFDALTRTLYARWRDALSWEETEDVVQETLTRKAPRAPDGRTSEQRRRWFAAVLNNAAIDYLRARDGRRPSEKARRPKYVPVLAGDEFPVAGGVRVDQLPDPGGDPERELLAATDAEVSRSVVERALARMPADEARLIRWRYLSEQQPTAAQMAQRLGLTAKQFEYRWMRAWLRFVARIAEDAPSSDCQAARRSMARGTDPVAPVVEHQRLSAHLAGCVNCRVFATRAKRVATLVPVLPVMGLARGVLGWAHRSMERLHGSAEHAASLTGGAGVGIAALATSKLAAGCATVTAACIAGALAVTPPVEPGVRPARAIMDHSPRSGARVSSLLGQSRTSAGGVIKTRVHGGGWCGQRAATAAPASPALWAGVGSARAMDPSRRRPATAPRPQDRHEGSAGGVTSRADCAVRADAARAAGSGRRSSDSDDPTGGS